MPAALNLFLQKESSHAEKKYAVFRVPVVGTYDCCSRDARIGPVKVRAIVAGQPCSTPEDIMKVKRIKEGSFSKIKELITVK